MPSTAPDPALAKGRNNESVSRYIVCISVIWMQVGWRGLGLAVLALGGSLAACQFPTPSQDYVCERDEDCDPERACSPGGYCVLRSAVEPDAAVTDAPPIDSMPIDGDPFAATAAACMAVGYTLEPSTMGYYKKVTSGANWNNASNDCNDDVAGATHLITLSTVEEVAFQRTINNAWIGWIDSPTEGMWHVLTAEVPVINIADYWGDRRPDGGDDENCAVMRLSNPDGIDDVDCPQNHPYICECDGRPVL